LTQVPPAPFDADDERLARPPKLAPRAEGGGDDGDPDEQGARMSFLDHLDELRRRLMIAAGAIVAGMAISFFFIRRIVAFVMDPLEALLPPDSRFLSTEMTEGFMLYMKIAALCGLLIASPVVMAQLWLFVAPGLYAHEKKLAIPFVILASGFFLLGAAFSHYFVFPFAFGFFANFFGTGSYIQFMPTIGPLFGAYVKMLLAMGVVFQLPTVVFFLARMGMITAGWLVKKTKYAILIIFITAAIITPGPDVVSQALVAAPMLVLYGVSIGIAWLVQKKKKIAD
jgi:sec-independent protein translocase protein TatC